MVRSDVAGTRLVSGLAPETRHAYLRRLGLDAEPPSAEALFRLHNAHVQLVPWETLWIHLGERWPTDPTVSARRVAEQGRGGYCFHLNGAFSELLTSLGYDVTRHTGGVHGPDGPVEDALGNHLVLTARHLRTADNPSGVWYVDVGLGDALYDPLPLTAGVYAEGPFRLELARCPEVSGWRLIHDAAGAFLGMAWRNLTVSMDAFAEKHEFLSTSPESPFVKRLTVQRRDATGVDALRGLVLVRIGAGATETTLTSRTDLEATLGDVFGIDLDAIGPDRLDRLWADTSAEHARWEAAGRP
jgi:arylamine N-acetyltransferase